MGGARLCCGKRRFVLVSWEAALHPPPYAAPFPGGTTTAFDLGIASVVAPRRDSGPFPAWDSDGAEPAFFGLLSARVRGQRSGGSRGLTIWQSQEDDASLTERPTGLARTHRRSRAREQQCGALVLRTTPPSPGALQRDPLAGSADCPFFG